jgi:hypothetical protein
VNFPLIRSLALAVYITFLRKCRGKFMELSTIGLQFVKPTENVLFLGGFKT